MDTFRAHLRPLLIGSFPLDDHGEAMRLVFEATPDIPLWVQLPFFAQEGMIRQFAPGLPGLVDDGERLYVDSASQTFDESLMGFYEDYLGVTEGDAPLSETRFAIQEKAAPGFFAFIDAINTLPEKPVALKGQITGPVTMATGLTDQDKRAVFYDDRLLDVVTKHLAMKARWQVEQLRAFGVPVIVFVDEPALAGFGTSAFVSITAEDVQRIIDEVVEGIHGVGGIAGVHVCANTDWSLILNSAADILSFDAYGYFDRLALYEGPLKTFLDQGRILAWGIVPTSDPKDIDRVDAIDLHAKLQGYIERLESFGISRDILEKQSLITPSCGTGSLSLDHAVKVLALTRQLSEKWRAEAV